MRQKMARFAEIEIRNNVIQPGKSNYETIKGNWRQAHFKNDNPIILELACGRGEYSVGMARLFSDKNFIGVDIKGDRIWKGSTAAVEEGLENVAFLRTQILLIDRFFEEGEVDQIWITFPDPRPRSRDERRRLTFPRFLELYKRILKPGGRIHLKTDNTGLFEYTLETIGARKDIVNIHSTFDLYHSPLKPECFDIRTKFEQKFNDQGHDIKYLRFDFKKE